MDTIRKVVIINKDSLAQNLDSLYTHGIHKMDSLVGQYEEWNDSASGIKRRFEIKTDRLKRVANKVVQEISMWEEDVSIDRVKEVLTMELKKPQHPHPI